MVMKKLVIQFSAETKKTALLGEYLLGERSIFIFMDESAYYKRWTPCSLSHAARNSERSSDSGQYADGYLKNCFPSVRFHFFEC